MPHSFFRFLFLLTVAALNCSSAIPASAAELSSLGAADWPWWRGPQRNGVADANQKPPLKWSEKENILWKSPVPGRGHCESNTNPDSILTPAPRLGFDVLVFTAPVLHAFVVEQTEVLTGFR